MIQALQNDIEKVSHIEAVPTILEVVHRITGLGFVAVARVTEDCWVACDVLDKIGLGLEAGSELRVETTICNEIRQSHKPVIINNVAEDEVWCRHATPAIYGFQSYISVPIILADGSFFGTLCALDRRPALLQTREIVGMFWLFAELIANHLEAYRKLAMTESVLAEEIALTQERQAALRISEARYRDVVETQTEMICRSLPDTTLTFVNDAYCRHFEKPREELIGTKFLELLPKAEQRRVGELIKATLEGQPSVPSDQQNLQSDGSTRWVQWINHVLRDENNGVEIQSVGRDITEQKRAQQELEKRQEELRSSQAQIQKLAGSLMKAQEEERRRIARELHDDISQRLAAVCISLADIKLRLPPSDSLYGQVAQVRERAKEIAKDIRNLSHGLHPVIFERTGLGGALQSLVAEFNDSQQVRFNLCLPEHLAPVSDEIATCIFRIAQEALRNISKHSRASHADIELSANDGSIKLLITDDGCGFGIDAAETRRGVGLISMAERVRQLQGLFEVRTKPGQGTSLVATVPIH
ncbi:MAG TPA: PAS domain S-box protein [Bryobacteraceae bacterium]